MLVCRAGPQTVALPLAAVLGVTEPSPVTPLPFSPPAIDGLVLAMNYAVVQMTVAPLFGADPPAVGSGVLVVTAQDDDVRALRFDAVVSMVEIDIETIAGDDVGIGDGMRRFTSGRFDWRGEGVAILDLPAIWSMGDIQAEDLPPPGGAALLLALDAGDPEPDASEAHERVPYLSFVSGGETYATLSGSIEEILLVDRVRPMPGAPEWVAGLVERRGLPILALDTRRLLGHASALDARTALIVPFPGGGSLALLVDEAEGIVFFSLDDPHPMAEAAAGIASYLIDDDGRIVGLLDAAQLLDQVAEAVIALMPRGGERETASAPPRPPLQHDEGERLLTLAVGDQVFALPLDRVDRIRADVGITALPRNDSGFTGVVDIGEMAVPIVDLRLKLSQGTGSPSPTRRPPCILTRLEGAVAGLVVDRVIRIEAVERGRIDPIEPLDRLPVSGVFRSLDGRMASILMVDRLLPVMPASLDR